MKNNTNHIAKSLNLTKLEFKEFWIEVQKLVENCVVSKTDLENAINNCHRQGNEQPVASDVADMIDPKRRDKRVAQDAEIAAQEAKTATQQAKELEDEHRKKCVSEMILCINQEIEKHQRQAWEQAIRYEVDKVVKDLQAKFALLLQQKIEENRNEFSAKLAASEKALTALKKRVVVLEGTNNSAHSKSAPLSKPILKSSFSLQDANSDGRVDFFRGIYKLAVTLILEAKPKFNFFQFQNAVANGTLPLNKAHTLAYMACYSGHHYHKLRAAFNRTDFADLQGKQIEIVDWGCGQAVATCILLDWLLETGIPLSIARMTLIEPSIDALNSGTNYIQQILEGIPSVQDYIRTVNVSLDNLADEQIVTNLSDIKIHLFSNILDVSGIDLDKLATRIERCSPGQNRFICSSPYYTESDKGCHRLQEFMNIFARSHNLTNKRETSQPTDKHPFYSFKEGEWVSDRISRFERRFTINF